MPVQVTSTNTFMVYNSAPVNEPDFVIKIRDYSWRVHSDIVSQNSEFFAKVCEGSFMEAQNKSVTLHDDDPSLVARMLQFMYCQTYMYSSIEGIKVGTQNEFPAVDDLLRIGASGWPEIISPASTITSPWLTCANMCVLADKYMMPAMVEKSKLHLILYMRILYHVFPEIVGILGLDYIQNDKYFCRSLLTPLANGIDPEHRYKIYKQAVGNDESVNETMMECMMEAGKTYDTLAQKAEETISQAIKDLSKARQNVKSQSMLPRDPMDIALESIQTTLQEFEPRSYILGSTPGDDFETRARLFSKIFAETTD